MAKEQEADFAKKKRALEIVSLQEDGDQPTVVSSAVGVKVLRNLQTAKKTLKIFQI